MFFSKYPPWRIFTHGYKLPGPDQVNLTKFLNFFWCCKKVNIKFFMGFHSWWHSEVEWMFYPLLGNTDRLHTVLPSLQRWESVTSERNKLKISKIVVAIMKHLFHCGTGSSPIHRRFCQRAHLSLWMTSLGKKTHVMCVFWRMAWN